MKKTLVLLSLCAGTIFSYAQTRQGVIQAPTGAIKHRVDQMPSGEKTLLCQDTLRYPQAKEQILGTSNFYEFDAWKQYNESISQTFLNTGSLTINGIEFYGAKGSSTNVTVSAAIYNVDASNNPTTLIGSGTVTITGTYTNTAADFLYRTATFASPLTVTGNYAIVLTPTNASAVLKYYVTDFAAGQSYDEDFTRYKSSYYPNSVGTYVSIPTLTTGDATNFPGTGNFEPLVAPIVSYTINTAYTASATTVCQGTPVTFTNATTPSAMLNNRMTNYQIFSTYFGTATSDSTFVYDMDNLSPYIWSGTTTYTHPAAGSYDVLLATNGGFWSSCFDFSTQTITVNAIPATPTITAGGPTTFCAGSSVTLTSSSPTGNTWSNGLTTPSITVSSPGTYSVSVTTAGCTSPTSGSTAVTVNAVDDASFAYSSSTLCSGGANEIPTATLAGTFSAPAGLNFVSTSTGEINMSTSTNGTYTISHTTAGICPATATQTITITAAPDASFSYGQSSYCALDTDPSAVFGSGASGGVFSSTTGLILNSSTGAIDLSASTAGTYTITNSIAAAGVCPAVNETFDVTVVGSTTPAFAAASTYCSGDAIAALPTTSTNTVTGTWSPAINNTATTTYTFTPDAGQCAATASMTITVNPVVIPAFAAASTYCSGDAIAALPTTSTNSVTGTWSPAINNTATTTYTFTPTAGQCATTATTTITVNPIVAPTFAPVAAICSGGAISALPTTSTNSVTGTWSPALSNTTTTTYTFTPDAGECATTATTTITVNPLPTVTFGAIAQLCVYNSPITLTQGAPAGGTYSGLGVTGTQFNPATAGLGTANLTYEYTDGNGCINSAASSVVVDACLGIQEIADLDVTIAPNPASESFVITANGINDLSYSVVSNDGKLVVAPRNITNGVAETVNVQGFARGIYFVKFSSATQTTTKKIIVD